MVLGSRAVGLGVRIRDFGCRVWEFGFRVKGYRDECVKFRASRLRFQDLG